MPSTRSPDGRRIPALLLCRTRRKSSSVHSWGWHSAPSPVSFAGAFPASPLCTPAVSYTHSPATPPAPPPSSLRYGRRDWRSYLHYTRRARLCASTSARQQASLRNCPTVRLRSAAGLRPIGQAALSQRPFTLSRARLLSARRPRPSQQCHSFSLLLRFPDFVSSLPWPLLLFSDNSEENRKVRRRLAAGLYTPAALCYIDKKCLVSGGSHGKKA